MRNMFLVIGAVSTLALVSVAACTTETGDTGEGGSGNTGNTGGTVNTGGSPGTGGDGTGGGATCATCSDFVFGDAEQADLCGYVDDNTCNPNSSCSFVDDIATCTCDANTCLTECQEACDQTGAPSALCQTCVTTQCSDQFNACTLDMGTEGG